MLTSKVNFACENYMKLIRLFLYIYIVTTAFP